MTEMAETTRAVHLGARHEKRAVGLGLHGIWQRLVEARPTGTAFELRVRGKKWQLATGTDKRTLAFFLVERTAAGSLSAVLAQHHVLVRIEPLAPLHVGELAKVCRFGRRHCFSLAKSICSRERRQPHPANQYCAPVQHQLSPLRRPHSCSSR